MSTSSLNWTERLPKVPKRLRKRIAQYEADRAEWLKKAAELQELDQELHRILQTQYTHDQIMAARAVSI